MKILHFGDLHVWRPGFDISDPFYPKRWLGSVNLILRRRHRFPPALGEAVMAEIAASDADLLIFSGDLSTLSQPSEFKRASDLFAPLREKWGDRLIAIPGNHDRYTPKTVKARRFESFFPYAALDDVRSHDITPQLVVVACDVCIPCKIRSNGIMTENRAAQLDAELARNSGKTVILVCHYPYATTPGIEETWEHKLLHEDRLADVIAKHKPAVYLHGHKHVRWALRPGVSPDTLCLNCGSAGMTSSSTEKQAGFVEFELSDDGRPDQLVAVHLDAATSTFVRRPLDIQTT